MNNSEFNGLLLVKPLYTFVYSIVAHTITVVVMIVNDCNGLTIQPNATDDAAGGTCACAAVDPIADDDDFDPVPRCFAEVTSVPGSGEATGRSA